MKNFLCVFACALLLCTAAVGCGNNDKDRKNDMSSFESKIHDTVSDTKSDVESDFSNIKSDIEDSEK